RISLIVRDSWKIHPEFDVEYAQRVFADAGEPLRAEQITSPWDLYAAETLRNQHQLRIGEAFPADVFVWAKGEPENPACTKVGGRPFWPADEPWPTTPDGLPCSFLAQFNFADSADIVGDDLAACVLVVLTNSQPDWLSDENSLSFHWVPRKTRSLLDANVPSAIG